MNETKIKTLNDILNSSDGNLLSLYYTLGYPKLEDIEPIFQAIQDSGKVDFIELGMPYSDPLADGPTIQKTSSIAIKNGITIEKYFEIAKDLSNRFKIPIVYMGYLNPIIQFGIDKFCHHCNGAGIEGLIIPDLPVDIYENEYAELFAKHQLSISFLITPTTSEERIRKIADLTTGFVYIVSSSSITGKQGEITDAQKAYFERVKLIIKNKPTMIGFGIYDQSSFNFASRYAKGAIIGSAFLRELEKGNYSKNISSFINSIKP